MNPTADNLNSFMEFDCVIRVDEDGNVTEAPGVYAPELNDGEVWGGEPWDIGKGDSWTLLDGYSGQCGYSGPIMHPSEFIGGRMAEDILATAGEYVALVSYYTPEDEDDDDNVDGWAVAYRLA